MDIQKLLDTNIESSQILITPLQIKDQLPLTESVAKTVLQGRQDIQNILEGKDTRKFIIVGPCSIHDTKAAEEYAEKLKTLADRVRDKLLIVMRVYLKSPEQLWDGKD
jgi:3-deoxy-7-phosphoheptulonate synthase